MRRLGISIYPDKSNINEMKKYIKKAANCGFSRIFSCLLSVDKPKDIIKKEFIEINEFAHEYGFEIIVDVSPKVFDKLGISYNDLSFFKEIKADGIRLDLGFSGNEEALMTYNNEQLKIEINMSNNVSTIDTIMDFHPNIDNLYACHNFYPHRYSGLSLKQFKDCNDRFKKYGIHSAAFIGTNTKDAYGPWDAKEGLVSLEVHRNKKMVTQAKHLIALEKIDDIIISNCYPSDEELLEISKISLDCVSFKCHLEVELDEIEEKILFEELHMNRGDLSDNFIRSTQSRVKYKNHEFKAKNTRSIHKGDIIIESSEYGHYAGEVQIALSDMENSGKSSVVGHIDEDEVFILDEIDAWQKFRFMR